MVNVSNTAQGLRKRSASGSKQGFSLVELMCVLAIISLMASLAWPSVMGLISGNGLTNNAYQLSGIVQQARAAALAQHTYVWVGFRSYANKDGVPSMMIATLADNCGLVSDLPDAQPANFSLASKPAVIQERRVGSHLDLYHASGYRFRRQHRCPDPEQLHLPSQRSRLPERSLQQRHRLRPRRPGLPHANLGLVATHAVHRMGINVAPNPGTHLHTAAIQVRGLTGQVSVFQQ